MTAISHAISAALLHFIWQGALVASLLWIALATLRSGSARLRYAVSCAVFAVMVILPLITALAVYNAPFPASGAGEIVDVPYSAPSTLSAPHSPPTWINALQAWALPVWCVGVLIFAVRLIRSSRYSAKLQREGDPAEAVLIDTVSRLAQRMGIGRPLRVLISRLTDSPSVAGWLRPVVLLPASALLNLKMDQLEAVLVHELAHIRRHDYLVNLLQTLAETLFFYHPALWWVSSRIRDERELCCDDLVVEIYGDAVGYARVLAKLERLRVISPELAMSITGNPLLYRIQRLTGVVREQSSSKLPAILALCVVALCSVVNLRWANAQSQNSPDATVRREAIWMEGVKYGDLPIMIRALGTITAPTTVELNVAGSQAKLVQNGQSASIELRRGITMAGKVARIGSEAFNGTVPVVVELQSPVPEFVREAIDGIIRVKTLHDVVYIGRPAVLQSNTESMLFKIEADGTHARRVTVRFGAQSVNSLQVLEGLQPGDRVILSDTTKYNSYERIRLE